MLQQSQHVMFVIESLVHLLHSVRLSNRLYPVSGTIFV